MNDLLNEQVLASELLVLRESGLEGALDVGERRGCGGGRVLGARERQGMGKKTGRALMLRLRFVGL